MCSLYINYTITVLVFYVEDNNNCHDIIKKILYHDNDDYINPEITKL